MNPVERSSLAKSRIHLRRRRHWNSGRCPGIFKTGGRRASYACCRSTGAVRRLRRCQGDARGSRFPIARTSERERLSAATRSDTSTIVRATGRSSSERRHSKKRSNTIGCAIDSLSIGLMHRGGWCRAMRGPRSLGIPGARNARCSGLMDVWCGQSSSSSGRALDTDPQTGRAAYNCRPRDDDIRDSSTVDRTCAVFDQPRWNRTLWSARQ